MLRRQFVKLIAAAGTGGLASIAAADASKSAGCQTVTYHVKGFSCITCAVGLDAMLKQQKGIVWSKSSYPDGTVIIKFDPKQVTGKSLKASIAEMGFTVEEKRPG
ncbi:MAG: heavy-metal-associated domain-containing protein [Terriglobales bacterium]